MGIFAFCRVGSAEMRDEEWDEEFETQTGVPGNTPLNSQAITR